MTCKALALVVLFVSIAPAKAGEASEDKAKRQFERWIAYYREVAEGYEVRLQSNPGEPLHVSVDPIHVYTNPSSGLDTHGAFFVWTHRGRAEAIGAIWSKLTHTGSSDRYVHHEFQSLATQSLVAKGREGLLWAPQGPGIELKEVEGAPPPAKTKVLRLAQMRAIARKFTGYHTNPTEFQLRLLAQPLFRYKEQEGEPFDGAIFGFFMDWDPEILLVLEDRATNAGPRWHFAAGRFSDKPVRLEYGGTEIWRHMGGDFGNPHGPFYAKLGVSRRPAVIDD